MRMAATLNAQRKLDSLYISLTHYIIRYLNISTLISVFYFHWISLNWAIPNNIHAQVTIQVYLKIEYMRWQHFKSNIEIITKRSYRLKFMQLKATSTSSIGFNLSMMLSFSERRHATRSVPLSSRWTCEYEMQKTDLYSYFKHN